MQGPKQLQKKLVIGMVGLPARGKTHISSKIYRYLNWLGYKSQVFSLIAFMRKDGEEYDPDMFDQEDEKCVQLKEKYVLIAMGELIDFLKKDGEIAIFNASNYTINQRNKVKNLLQIQVPKCQLFWVESSCNDMEVILNNIQTTKLGCKKYKNCDVKEATQDFLQKVEKIAKKYEPVDMEKNTSYIQVVDIGKHIYIHQLDGFLQSKIVSFLMNLHIYPRPIYFCRTGQCQFSTENRMGGDSELTKKGLEHAFKLANAFKEELEEQKTDCGIKILTSTLKRGLTTAEVISKTLGTTFMSLKTLDELDFGLCDGMLLREIMDKFPEKIKEREKDKLRFRYPRGESYLDAITRIEPVIFEIERYREPVIIIAHGDIIKCLYAYFHQNNIADIPDIDIPKNCIVKLIPQAYKCKETKIYLDVNENKIQQQN